MVHNWANNWANAVRRARDPDSEGNPHLPPNRRFDRFYTLVPRICALISLGLGIVAVLIVIHLYASMDDPLGDGFLGLTALLRQLGSWVPLIFSAGLLFGLAGLGSNLKKVSISGIVLGLIFSPLLYIKLNQLIRLAHQAASG